MNLTHGTIRLAQTVDAWTAEDAHRIRGYRDSTSGAGGEGRDIISSRTTGKDGVAVPF